MKIQTIDDLQTAVQVGLEALRNVPLTPEAELARELLLPDGFTPVIELVQENGRKKRSSAAAWNWNPQVDRVLISFRASEDSYSTAVEAPQFPTATSEPDKTVPTQGVPSRFQPIVVRGEAVSTTLLRDRGSI